MKLVSGLSQLQGALAGCCLTWGNFDGVHLGHQKLLKVLFAEAAGLSLPAVVLTFTPHPRQVLGGDPHFRPLFSREDLVERMTALGVDILVIEPFVESLSKMSPRAFVEDLLWQKLRPKKLVVGHDMGFGYQRSGTLETLKVFGADLGYDVIQVPPLYQNSTVVSSRQIKLELEKGDVRRASELLGRPFSIRGLVEAGRGRGAQIGVRTANINPAKVITPRFGVYVTRTVLRPEGGSWPSVTNVGVAPTLKGDQVAWVETHILGQDLNLYGAEMEVEFLDYLREERRFSSADELKSQIQLDIEAAQRFWNL